MANYPGDYTPNFALVKPIVGGDSGAWGTLLNGGVMAVLDTILGSSATISISTVDVTLTTTQFQNMAFIMTGTLTGNHSLILPLNNITSPTQAPGGNFIVYNNTGGAFSLTVKTQISTGANVTVGQGQIASLWSDGVNVMYDNTGLPASVKAVSGSPQGQLAGTAGSVNQNASIAADYAAGALYLCTQSGTAGSALWASTGGLASFLPQNAALTASVSGNVLTVGLLAASTNTTPASGVPVIIPFGDAVGTAGDISSVTVTGTTAVSTIVGASLGAGNSTPFRLWVGAFNNAGTVVLGLTNCLSTTGILFPLDDSVLRSTVQMSSGATSAGVFYTPSGVTLSNKAFRLLGYIEYSGGLVTAGTFNTSPTALRLFGPGVKKPGDVVQQVANFTTALVSATTPTAITFADTAPTSSGGFPVVDATTTPLSVMNLWEIKTQTMVNVSNGQTCAVAFVIQDTAGTTAIGATEIDVFVGVQTPVSLEFQRQVSTTAVTVFQTRVGGDAASNWFINGNNTGRKYGGTLQTMLKIVERMG